MHFGDDRYFEEGLAVFSRSSTRREMLERFGVPTKSGGGIKHPILANFGPWDRFTTANYSIDIEY